jgi:hypothetical protein
MSTDRYTLEEWQTELKRLAGGEFTAAAIRSVTFVCPSCGETHSVGEFYDAAKARGDDMTDWDPTVAAQQCLHRFVGDDTCDWCSFGLFRGPVIIVSPDGHESGVFRFGEPLPAVTS